MEGGLTMDAFTLSELQKLNRQMETVKQTLNYYEAYLKSIERLLIDIEKNTRKEGNLENVC